LSGITQGSKYYSAVGQCIYCGATEYEKDSFRKLGDEHIIPEGLGGIAVLKEASCKDCERTINLFEQPIIRGTYQVARKLIGVKSKKKRRNNLVDPIRLRVKTQNNERLIEVPIEDYPGLIVTLTFHQPRILSGAQLTPEPISGGVAIATLPYFGERLNAIIGMPITSFQGSISIEPPRTDVDATKLARFIAKISHAYATAELGIGNFHPYLKDLIRGRSPEFLSHYIGGTYDERLVPTDSTYDLSLALRYDRFGQPHWTCSVRIFSHFSGMPKYLAVVGKPLDP